MLSEINFNEALASSHSDACVYLHLVLAVERKTKKELGSVAVWHSEEDNYFARSIAISWFERNVFNNTAEHDGLFDWGCDSVIIAKFNKSTNTKEDV